MVEDVEAEVDAGASGQVHVAQGDGLDGASHEEPGGVAAQDFAEDLPGVGQVGDVLGVDLGSAGHGVDLGQKLCFDVRVSGGLVEGPGEGGAHGARAGDEQVQDLVTDFPIRHAGPALAVAGVDQGGQQPAGVLFSGAPLVDLLPDHAAQCGHGPVGFRVGARLVRPGQT
ncbi:hypothetical protein OG562_03390 [Streptomyces sp. NBC_01275]|nr:hypothetical protein [Streptomyces sp. NBC_01275]MCX4760046.1 hypothetical protein [Streptomyces sp. NBC_01275]